MGNRTAKTPFDRRLRSFILGIAIYLTRTPTSPELMLQICKSKARRNRAYIVSHVVIDLNELGER
jgi:hypothetical protein